MQKVLLVADLFENHSHLEIHLKQEWEGKRSVEFIADTLIASGFETEIIDNKNKLIKLLSNISSNDKKKTILFNLIEGFDSRNRESYIPGLAEMIGIPHTGSDAYAQNLTLDKYLTGLIAEKISVPVKPKIILHTENEIKKFCMMKFSDPLFIKPRYEGSGSGIGDWSIITDGKEALIEILALHRKFGDLIAEDYLAGNEYTVAVIGNQNNYRVSTVARIEITGRVYGEEIKSKESMSEKLVFDVPLTKIEFIQQETIRICQEIGIAGYARADWKEDFNGDPFLLELNLTPGLSYFYSSYPICYMRSFGSYKDMLDEILFWAMAEFSHRRFSYGKLL